MNKQFFDRGPKGHKDFIRAVYGRFGELLQRCSHKGIEQFTSIRLGLVAQWHPYAEDRTYIIKKKIKNDDRFAVYDSKGDNDRYTVIDLMWCERYPVAGSKKKYLYDCLGFNNVPTNPSHGVSQFSSCNMGRHLGKRIKFSQLPRDLQKHVIERFMS